MSSVMLQVPYAATEQQFLLQAVQVALTTYRRLNAASANGTERRTETGCAPSTSTPTQHDGNGGGVGSRSWVPPPATQVRWLRKTIGLSS